jgi:hypothetical protein
MIQIDKCKGRTEIIWLMGFYNGEGNLSSLNERSLMKNPEEGDDDI